MGGNAVRQHARTERGADIVEFRWWRLVTQAPKGFPSPERFSSLSGSHLEDLACRGKGPSSISILAPRLSEATWS